ncbi:hypothetical protein DPMN_054702 [Dreissena polymorpha]|uniref:ATPase dynein-related AAA domain-containing protein n=1 Tax=Dreissena polymorpha TaxID=45954 RepID=A0A9D4HRT8_DREPO|nr:hypothetical protein DPMN_054702 [Dreissena polymorpha]
MKGGAMFLVDEISLADDSVLERLNSVLEPERTILLAEKGGGDGATNQVEQVVAKDGFQVFATMNPGGDFGKKEVGNLLIFQDLCYCSTFSIENIRYLDDYYKIIKHSVLLIAKDFQIYDFGFKKCWEINVFFMLVESHFRYAQHKKN